MYFHGFSPMCQTLVGNKKAPTAQGHYSPKKMRARGVDTMETICWMCSNKMACRKKSNVSQPWRSRRTALRVFRRFPVLTHLIQLTAVEQKPVNQPSGVQGVYLEHWGWKTLNETKCRYRALQNYPHPTFCTFPHIGVHDAVYFLVFYEIEYYIVV